MAALACRCPPRFNRILLVLPLEAGIGRFKRSSQRFQIGGCDDKPQTRLRAQHTKQTIFTRATACGVTCSAGHILGTDQTRRFQRGGWHARWCVCPRWQSLVPRGRRHATIIKRSAFNLRHQLKAERVQRLSGARHFAKICVSGFSRNALVCTFISAAFRSVSLFCRTRGDRVV